jgi:ABC-type nitrate/sulfonate/bicarbonate transport system substrate-binding protein
MLSFERGANIERREFVVPTMRHYLRALLISSALLGAELAHANDPIRVAKAQGSAWAFLPLDVGIERSLFGQQGLDVEAADMGGDAKVQQALAAGSVEFGLGSGPGMAFAAKGSPAIAVAAFAGPPRNISAIVLDNSTIKQIADLKGKRIAVSTPGSLSDWLAKQMAIQEGWGQEGIQAVPLGAIPTSIAALKTKQVDAVVLATEAGLRLEEQNEGRVLATMDRYAPHFITHVVFAQKSLVANNSSLVARFLRGFFAAIAFVKTHKDETSSLAERVLQWSPDLARKVYDLEAGMFIDDGRFEPLAVSVLKQSFIDMKTLRSVPTDDELFTTQFVPIRP